MKSESDYTKIFNFFTDIFEIVALQNLTLKFDGPKQILEIVNEAAEVEGLNLKFDEKNRIWILLDTNYTREEFNSLHVLKKRFSKIYRHHAMDYAKGERRELLELIEGFDVEMEMLNDGYKEID